MYRGLKDGNTYILTSFPSQKALFEVEDLPCLSVDEKKLFRFQERATMLLSRNFSVLILCFIQFCLLDFSVGESPPVTEGRLQIQ